MKKKTLQYCVDLAAEREGFCLSTEYKNADAKMLWKCKANHTWSISSSSIKQGTWCRRCHQDSMIIRIADCHVLARSRNAECLSTVCNGAKSRIDWKCGCGHTWTSTYRSANGGKWCGKCSGNLKNTIEDCHAIAAKNDGLCLSTEYVNARTKLKWQCHKGHTWMAHYGSVLGMNSWCRRCGTSKTEKQVRDIFVDMFDAEFPTIRPTWLRNPLTNRPLELDGYNVELKLAFEYDGEQHYKAMSIWGGEESFERLQIRDRFKDKTCKEYGVHLIRIPYTEKNNLKKYIDNKIAHFRINETNSN